jgi:hypothetical protein
MHERAGTRPANISPFELFALQAEERNGPRVGSTA